MADANTMAQLIQREQYSDAPVVEANSTPEAPVESVAKPAAVDAAATVNPNPSTTATSPQQQQLQQQQELQTVNPFGPYEADDRFRPYYSAAVERPDTIATIVIAQQGDVEDGDKSKDFFASFKSTIEKPGSTVALGKANKIVRISDGFYGVFKNFSLSDVGEVNAEVVKISINFGLAWTAYFFGRQPQVYSFSGIFLDAANYPFYEQFMTAYRTHLRGSELARMGYRFYIAYDGKIASGYMLGININSNSNNKTIKSFSVQVLIDNEDFFRTNMGENNGIDNSRLLK